MTDERSPSVYLLRPEQLRAGRETVRAGDAGVRPAVDRLQADAEGAMDAGPFSVTFGDSVAPSGDPHDYMSLGVYWWPNPDTDDGLPYVRRDGEINPEIHDYDGSSRKEMAKAVSTLSLAGYFLDEARYSEYAAELLQTWFLDPDTRMNPHLRYGQGVPGRADGRSYGLIETAKFVKLVDAIGLLSASGALSADVLSGLRSWFSDYLDWLQTSELGKQEADNHNNHRTWYDVQVASFALFVGDEETAESVLREVPTRHIAHHVEPDGRQPYELDRTRPLHYSIYNLRAMFQLARLGEHVDVKGDSDGDLDLWSYETDDGRSIRTAVDWLLHYLTGEEAFEYEQIADTNWDRAAEVLRRTAIVYDDPEYEAGIESIPEITPEELRIALTYPTSHGRNDS